MKIIVEGDKCLRCRDITVKIILRSIGKNGLLGGGGAHSSSKAPGESVRGADHYFVVYVGSTLPPPQSLITSLSPRLSPSLSESIQYGTLSPLPSGSDLPDLTRVKASQNLDLTIISK